MEPQALPTEDYRYWAFISYSSKDAKWGRWLHRAIETYGIPAQLTGKPTPTGHASPKRFHPLFRDRDELAASSDLGAQIEAALRTSRYLIVICSPNAAHSEWVNKEITTFQSMGRQGRILAIIVDGEPNAADDRECFPPALSTFEPTAADARPVGDGRENAKLKLLAGMLGVGFDALKQRDAQRKIHRLQLVVAASALVILSLAGMAWYSNHQRQRAIAARQQAESILEFLLYDLRDKLEPIGRLDIVRDVQDRVDSYYHTLGVENAARNSERNLASALANKGKLAFEQGDMTTALKAFQDSRGILQRLTIAHRDTTTYQRDLSITSIKIGDVLAVQGDIPGAIIAYKEALRTAHTSTNVSDLRVQAIAYSKIAESQQAQGILTESLNAFKESHAILKGLAVNYPPNTEHQRDISICEDSIGELLYAQGDLAAARSAFERSFDIRKHLTTLDPSNTQWQHDVSVSLSHIGDIIRADGNLVEALKRFTEALAIDQRLASRDPSNVEWQHALSVGLDKVGGALCEQKEVPAAQKAYLDSLIIRKRLADTDPNNADFQDSLSVGYERVGDVLHSQGDHTAALEKFHNALEIRKRLSAQDPSNARRQRDYSVIIFTTGRIRHSQGDLPAALDAFKEAISIREKLTKRTPENYIWLCDLAENYIGIGDVYRDQSDLTAALSAFESSLTIAKQLVKTAPSKVHWKRVLSVSHHKIGEIFRAKGDYPAALIEYRESLSIAQQLADVDPTNTVWQKDIYVSLERIGDVLRLQGNHPAALNAFKESLAIQKRLADSNPANADWQRGLFVSYTKLATLAEKSSSPDARDWWQKAYDQLSEMKQRGILLPTDEQYLEQIRQKLGQ